MTCAFLFPPRLPAFIRFINTSLFGPLLCRAVDWQDTPNGSRFKFERLRLERLLDHRPTFVPADAFS
jgi:hypothetical protein